MKCFSAAAVSQFRRAVGAVCGHALVIQSDRSQPFGAPGQTMLRVCCVEGGLGNFCEFWEPL